MLNALVLPLLFLALSFVIFQQDILVIHDLWLNNHSHDLGYPALAISLFFSYQSWANKPAYRWIPPLFLLLIGLSGAVTLYILADTAILQAPRLLAFLLIFIFFVAINVSPQQRLGQILAFSILLYTIPIWGIFTNLLQLLTVKATSFGLDISEIPANIHGYYISLPGGTLEVEEGCAGLRYLVTTLLICHIFCLLNKTRLSGWILMFTAGVVLALIANWIRVYILSYVAYKTDLQHPWMQDHAALGWGVYAFIYIPLYFISGFIINKKTSAHEFSFFDSSTKTAKKPSLLMLLITLLIVIAPYALKLTKQAAPHAPAVTVVFPENIGLCYLSKNKPDLIPAYSGFSQRFSASYDCTEGSLEAHYLLYSRQTQGKELINVFNTLLDSKTWNHVRSSHYDNNHDIALNVFVNEKREYAITAHSYVIAGTSTSSSSQVRRKMVEKGLLQDIPAKLISNAMRCKTDCSDEEKFISNFFISYSKKITPQ